MSDESLKQHIVSEMKAAMKAGNKPRLATIRLITAAIKQREVDERIELNDQQVIEALDKMAKQRRESISQFRAAERDDLADKEEAELAVIQEFLPTALSEAEIDQLIRDAKQASGATGMKEMGKMMAILRPQLQGRADMSQVSAQIKALLSA